MYSLPMHLLSSEARRKPERQVHLKLPGVLTQLWWQPPFLCSEHSSMSLKYCKKIYLKMQHNSNPNPPPPPSPNRASDTLICNQPTHVSSESPVHDIKMRRKCNMQSPTDVERGDKRKTVSRVNAELLKKRGEQNALSFLLLCFCSSQIRVKWRHTLSDNRVKQVSNW